MHCAKASLVQWQNLAVGQAIDEVAEFGPDARGAGEIAKGWQNAHALAKVKTRDSDSRAADAKQFDCRMYVPSQNVAVRRFFGIVSVDKGRLRERFVDTSKAAFNRWIAGAAIVIAADKKRIQVGPARSPRRDRGKRFPCPPCPSVQQIAQNDESLRLRRRQRRVQARKRRCRRPSRQR